MADQQSSPDGWDPQHCPRPARHPGGAVLHVRGCAAGDGGGDAEMVEQEALAGVSWMLGGGCRCSPTSGTAARRLGPRVRLPV